MTRRRSAIGLACGLGISLFAAPALASMQEVQIAAGDLPGLVEAVHAEVVDNVVDGCWTNISDVEALTIRILTENGIRIASVQQPDTAFHPALIISGAGSRVNGSYCLVQAEISVSFVDSSRFADATGEGGA